MKIAIVNLASSGLSGGYLKYLLNLVPLLRRDPRVTTLDVFIPDGVALPGCGSLRTWPARDGVTGFPALRAELARLAPDVVFFPTARLVDCGGVPTIVMVRNMEPLTVPFGGNSWRESLRNLARARAARRACERATRVIAVSDYVRRFVTGRWGLSASRVGRVYHGVNPPDPASEIAPASLQPVERFVFTAGSIRPARGLEDLIRATPALLRDHPDLAVVIAGKVDEVAHAYGARMQHLAAKLGVARAVVWTGQLSSPEMAWAVRALRRVRRDEPGRGVSERRARGAQSWRARGLDLAGSDARILRGHRDLLSSREAGRTRVQGERDDGATVSGRWPPPRSGARPRGRLSVASNRR